MIVVIIIAIFMSMALFFLTFSSFMQKKIYSEEKQIQRRLDDLRKSMDPNRKNMPVIVRDEQLSRSPLLNKLLEKLKVADNLTKLLEQAGVTMKVGQLILIMIVCAFAGMLILYPIVGPILAVLVGLLLGGLPLLHVKNLRSKRIQAFTRQFPDAIDMMCGALKSGYAFNKTMQLVAQEAPNPVGVEFRKAFEEQNLGIPLFEALEKMTHRVESPDLRLFVTAVLLQRETGGNLTEILNKIGYTIRQRFKLLGQIKSYTAQGRLSAWIISLLPFALLLLLTIINPDYTRPLFVDPVGQMILGLAIVLELVGFLFIRKIIHIKLS